MDVNRISGYIPGKIVFFLMQVCKAGVARVRKIWLTRHGESEYNLALKLGGDSPLSARGEAYARLLPDVIVERVPLTSDGGTMPVSVWTSTLVRTIQTAELLPFPKLRWKVRFLSVIFFIFCSRPFFCSSRERRKNVLLFPRSLHLFLP